jgi:hypothetical protein
MLLGSFVAKAASEPHWIALLSASDVLSIRYWVAIVGLTVSTLTAATISTAHDLLNALSQLKPIPSESCPICAGKLSFNPQSPTRSDCRCCGVGIDRCMWSLHVIPTDESQQVYGCPLCKTVCAWPLAPPCEELLNVLHDQPNPLLCLYCRVLMNPLNKVSYP